MIYKLLFLSIVANIVLMFLAYPMPKGNLQRGLWKLWRWNLLFGFILICLNVYQGGGK